MSSYFDVDPDRFLTCAEAEVLVHFDHVSNRQKVILAHAARTLGQEIRESMMIDREVPLTRNLIPYGRDVGLEIRIRAALQENPPLPSLSEWDRAMIAADLALAFMALHEIHGWSVEVGSGSDNLHRALEMPSFASPLTDLTPSERAVFDLCLDAVRRSYDRTDVEAAESELWHRFQVTWARHRIEEVDPTDTEMNRKLAQRFVDAKFDPEFEGQLFIALGAEPIAA